MPPVAPPVPPLPPLPLVPPAALQSSLLAQVPFGAPVSRCAQDEQLVVHALSQQKPSPHAPEAQTRHPSARQSAPATGSQARPCVFLGWQSPKALQYSPL